MRERERENERKKRERMICFCAFGCICVVYVIYKNVCYRILNLTSNFNAVPRGGYSDDKKNPKIKTGYPAIQVQPKERPPCDRASPNRHPGVKRKKNNTNTPTGTAQSRIR